VFFVAEKDESLYALDVDEDYVFYSNPVSRAASLYGEETDTTTPDLVAHAKNAHRSDKMEVPALYTPDVRKQLQKLKAHQPWFLGIMTVIQVLALVGSFILNWRVTGRAIQTNPFNYMIGPDSGVSYLA
jgi:hypothetical protein